LVQRVAATVRPVSMAGTEAASVCFQNRIALIEILLYQVVALVVPLEALPLILAVVWIPNSVLQSVQSLFDPDLIAGPDSVAHQTSVPH